MCRSAKERRLRRRSVVLIRQLQRAHPSDGIAVVRELVQRGDVVGAAAAFRGASEGGFYDEETLLRGAVLTTEESREADVRAAAVGRLNREADVRARASRCRRDASYAMVTRFAAKDGNRNAREALRIMARRRRAGTIGAVRRDPAHVSKLPRRRARASHGPRAGARSRVRASRAGPDDGPARPEPPAHDVARRRLFTPPRSRGRR